MRELKSIERIKVEFNGESIDPSIINSIRFPSELQLPDIVEDMFHNFGKEHDDKDVIPDFDLSEKFKRYRINDRFYDERWFV